MRRTLIYVFSIYVLTLLVLLFYLKQIRLFFNPSQISDLKIIGYSQYYGYPFYFDTVLYLLIILAPSLLFLIFIYFKKNE